MGRDYNKNICNPSQIKGAAIGAESVPRRRFARGRYDTSRPGQNQIRQEVGPLDGDGRAPAPRTHLCFK